MEIQSGNTAAMSAISRTDSEAEMDAKRFKDEMRFQTVLSIAKKLLRDEVITAEDYKKIRSHFLEKYDPIIGNLTAENELT